MIITPKVTKTELRLRYSNHQSLNDLLKLPKRDLVTALCIVRDVLRSCLYVNPDEVRKILIKLERLFQNTGKEELLQNIISQIYERR
ncbi:MAG: hypothetical protein QXI58_06135 [Candidatus Micrarchaeia archaeon]